VTGALFRHKVLRLLRGRGLLGEEWVELLLSWRRSGFSVQDRVFAHPGNRREFEALVRYMMRSPVSLSRLRFTPGSAKLRSPPTAPRGSYPLQGSRRELRRGGTSSRSILRSHR
jgi:hypothetical protein